ncbi:aldo/keto reductase [Gehongia tenuis]|uniref:Aldo/keto reductase n=1 Tax=Gehongia tenuis TaxID=2763655 RepID=A0A926D4W1_9FIRM|nr:aldo/keto reductase [Gehongia tenuis]MBC8531773.1 aldo/keto reductase [Gehongia tenuis]
MIYQKLGETGCKVSRVGLGTWAMGGDFWGSVTEQQAIATVRSALDRGINLVDTAPAYGKGRAERLVGRAIQGRRDEVVLATKIGLVWEGGMRHCLAPETLAGQLEASLMRLQVETVDLLQIHWPDPQTPLEDTLTELERLQRAGKFRYLGVSNFDLPLLQEALSKGSVVSVQNEYSLLCRAPEALMPLCEREGVTLMGYGSLAGGMLTGKYRGMPEERYDRRVKFYPYFKQPHLGRALRTVEALEKAARERGVLPAQMAIAWTLAHQHTVALAGAKTPEQVRSNAKAAELTLSAAEMDGLISFPDE